MIKPDDKFLDGLLDSLAQAPRTQIDEDIVTKIKKFMSETHTTQEKYDFIQSISREPLNMISQNVGVGRITPFVKQICDLDAMKNYGETLDKVLIPEEPIEDVIPEGYVKKYGWDGKPIICKDESEESKVTVQYLIDNQDENRQKDVMVKIFTYMEDLMWADKFKVIDDFIFDFCMKDICFQYCLCLLTCACWAKDKLKNVDGLRFKAREIGYKEIGEKDTESCLKGLI